MVGGESCCCVRRKTVVKNQVCPFIRQSREIKDLLAASAAQIVLCWFTARTSRLQASNSKGIPTLTMTISRSTSKPDTSVQAQPILTHLPSPEHRHCKDQALNEGRYFWCCPRTLSRLDLSWLSSRSSTWRTCCFVFSCTSICHKPSKPRPQGPQANAPADLNCS